MSHKHVIKHLEEQAKKIDDATSDWRREAESRKEAYEDALRQVSERELLARQYREAADSLRYQDKIEQDLAE